MTENQVRDAHLLDPTPIDDPPMPDPELNALIDDALPLTPEGESR